MLTIHQGFMKAAKKLSENKGEKLLMNKSQFRKNVNLKIYKVRKGANFDSYKQFTNLVLQMSESLFELL